MGELTVVQAMEAERIRPGTGDGNRIWWCGGRIQTPRGMGELSVVQAMEAGRILPGAGHGGIPPPPATLAAADLAGGGATSLLPRPDLVAARVGSHLLGGARGCGRPWGCAEQAGSSAGFEMGWPMGLGFFYFFTPLTEAGKETASVKVRLTVTLAPRWLLCSPR
jgi:hypothetical protein